MDYIKKMKTSLRRRNYSYRTEKSYIDWVARFIQFHKGKELESLTAEDVVKYLNYLAIKREVAAGTQNQALCAIVYLFKQVLEKEVGNLKGLKRAKEPKTLPVVLSADEVKSILTHMKGIQKVIIFLLYGTGLRISEALRLRVLDIDFANNQIYARSAKGLKDRTTLLPSNLKTTLEKQIERVRRQHGIDQAKGYGKVVLPKALARKYPNEAGKLRWQYLFPSSQMARDPRSGKTQRYHLSSSYIRKALADAVEKAGINKKVGPHTFRHTFATQMLENGYNIRVVQKLLGHKRITTTEKYTHVVANNTEFESPADLLA